ncbi:TetR/AcrR family transcriptional regulator [Phytomonospora endophytica]|uniref:TetR/AcrR family transcriptional repressor of nem operon n=1 Tax=Phytomonospora endophytica TaxID=714109 RepID=A0A841FU57_9ACTN|nr:TetR/AcrR family transcriptional regulator [Phytomonospora endophytica]MBB6038313.1 TetR/AcrR family transcriptional repressor of nem operon [Phytomonospora endophytica]GIG64244.1 TetR family transcriptional regulator [Phytomonospora endophytica]
MGRPKQFDPDVALDRAMHTFWSKGYAATTPQDLVDELGIGKGSLYNTFGGKHDLFLAALRRYAEGAARQFTELMAEPGPVRERVRRILDATVDPSPPQAAGDGCLAVNTAAELARSDEESARIVRTMFARTESALAAVLEQGRRDGEIAADRDPKALAAHLFATLVGLRVLMKTTTDPATLRPVVDAAIAAL